MDKPDGLEPSGEKLWEKVTSEAKFDAAGYALLADICRTEDIIARLTKRLNSKHHEWVRLVEDAGYGGEGKKVLVVVDNALAEIRQQRLAKRQMMQHLSLGKVSTQTAGQQTKIWDNMAEFEKDMQKET